MKAAHVRNGSREIAELDKLTGSEFSLDLKV